MHLGRTLQETWTVNELVTQTAKAKCMNELNIKSKNEYIHRNIRINRCNDNCIPDAKVDTDIFWALLKHVISVHSWTLRMGKIEQYHLQMLQ